MTPAAFPEAFVFFGPPAGYAESQVGTVSAWRGHAERGSMEGAPLIVVAWEPSEADLAALSAPGGKLYLTFVGGLPPHFPSTSFAAASRPA